MSAISSTTNIAGSLFSAAKGRFASAPREAKLLGVGGAASMVLGGGGIIDTVLNIGGIASIFCPVLMPFVAAGFLLKGGFSVLKGFGSLLKGDLGGAFSNFLAGGINIFCALPMGKLASSFNMLKTKSMNVVGLEGKNLTQFSLNNLSNPAEALKTMSGNVTRLKGGLDAEKGIIEGFTQRLGQAERGIAKSARVTPASLTDDVIRATQQKLDSAVKVAQKASESAAQIAKQAGEKAVKDVALKEAAEKLAKEAADKANVLVQLQQKQQTFQKLLDQRVQALKDIELATVRRNEWQRLYDSSTKATMKLDAARRTGQVATREAEILRTYEQSLQTVTVNPRQFFDEAVEIFYGPKVREQIGGFFGRVTQIGKSVKESVQNNGGVTGATRNLFRGGPQRTPAPSGFEYSPGGVLVQKSWAA